MCIKEYELDPAHFLSLPGLELELQNTEYRIRVIN